MNRPWKIAAINFDHMHMGDLLRMVHEHPNAEIVGVCDEERERMAAVIENFALPEDKVFLDYDACLQATKPDLVILCPATADHAKWTERVAPFGVHVLVEKPFAASVEEADAMIAALKKTGKQLVINWPLRWVAAHATTKRLIDEGLIGSVKEVHYYDGNRGPLWHSADKVEMQPTPERKARSWFYKKASGGGSLLDYLGYGTTLGTWFMNGRAPIEVTSTVDQTSGLEVDEHSITVARYESGLSKFETRWGTFTDPWVHQPQPKCGFVAVGEKGTISSYDYEESIRIQTMDNPEGFLMEADEMTPPFQNPIQYTLHCIENDTLVEGPLSPEISRVGQLIVDAAVESAASKRTVSLSR